MSGMLTTYQSAWEPLRTADVTADDTALDTTTPTTTYWDMTSKDCYRLNPNANAIEIIFLGEADDTDYFACRIYGKAPGGPAEMICEVSGHMGNATAPNDGSVTVDTTTWKIADHIVLEATNTFHVRDITVADLSTDRVAKLFFDTAGLTWLYTEFYNVGDDTEVHRIRPYGRYF